MATLAASALLLLASLGVDDVQSLADQAGVDVIDLRGAINTTGLDPRSYLLMVGELDPPPPPGPTFSPGLMARVACIESKESQGANVWNRQGSGAGGVMQYLESTFRSHAAEMGHPEYSRWVPWQARLVAAHDLALGRRAQWTVGGC